MFNNDKMLILKLVRRSCATDKRPTRTGVMAGRSPQTAHGATAELRRGGGATRSGASAPRAAALATTGLPRRQRGAAQPPPVVPATVATALRVENHLAYDGSRGIVRVVTAYNEDMQARRAVVAAAAQLGGGGQWDPATRSVVLPADVDPTARDRGTVSRAMWSPGAVPRDEAADVGVPGSPGGLPVTAAFVDARAPYELGMSPPLRRAHEPCVQDDFDDSSDPPALDSARVAELEATESGAAPRMPRGGQAGAGPGATRLAAVAPAGVAHVSVGAGSVSPDRGRPRLRAPPVDLAEAARDPYGSAEIDSFLVGFVRRARRVPMALRIQAWWRMTYCLRKYARWRLRRREVMRDTLAVWKISRKVRVRTAERVRSALKSRARCFARLARRPTTSCGGRFCASTSRYGPMTPRTPTPRR